MVVAEALLCEEVVVACPALELDEIDTDDEDDESWVAGVDVDVETCDVVVEEGRLAVVSQNFDLQRPRHSERPVS